MSVYAGKRNEENGRRLEHLICNQRVLGPNPSAGLSHLFNHLQRLRILAYICVRILCVQVGCFSVPSLLASKPTAAPVSACIASILRMCARSLSIPGIRKCAYSRGISMASVPVQ
jgi:hypothetical protein